MNYKVIAEYSYKSSRPKILTDSNEYHCRFCNKTKDANAFKKKAHAVSELIGNKSIISKYECDECNIKFSKNEENELGEFIKLYRAIRGFRGKKGLIKIDHGIKMEHDFEKKIQKIKMEFNRDRSNKFKMTITQEENEYYGIVFQREVELDYLLIYRCFLKFALSVVAESECKELSQGYEILRGDRELSMMPMNVIIYKNPIKEQKIKIYKRVTSNNLPKLFCTIDVFQYTYMVFLDFDNECNYAPLEIVESDLVLGKDTVYSTKMVQWTKEIKKEIQSEKITGKLSL